LDGGRKAWVRIRIPRPEPERESAWQMIKIIFKMAILIATIHDKFIPTH
jgi:hypothetical protein